jgi:hypothetical protein
VLWIPCFNNKEQHKFDTPNVLSDVKISAVVDEDTIKYGIKCISQVTNIEMNYDKKYDSNIKIQPSKSDIVLDDNFLVAAINYDILSDIKIPAVVLSIIGKDSWIKP